MRDLSFPPSSGKLRNTMAFLKIHWWSIVKIFQNRAVGKIKFPWLSNNEELWEKIEATIERHKGYQIIQFVIISQVEKKDEKILSFLVYIDIRFTREHCDVSAIPIRKPKNTNPRPRRTRERCLFSEPVYCIYMRCELQTGRVPVFIKIPMNSNDTRYTCERSTISLTSQLIWIYVLQNLIYTLFIVHLSTFWLFN